MTAHYTKCTPRKKTAFLRELRRCGLINKAADACRLSRSVLYQHKRKSKTFAADWDHAVDDAVDSVLIEEATRRAVQGVKKPLAYQGELTGDYVREYSDSLLMFLIKGKRPEYRNSISMGRTGEGAPAVVHFSMILPEQLPGS